ncbi:MAG: LysR family transcriptional regulator [Ancalomicrobiaceae bacterium]|nr:LysR family transcriptional regulator [Ancalomicrobiaceae bacterium]
MDTFTRMQAFVQVAEAGGFSAAARRMSKSKALISKYVRDLEDELGVRLLNRTTRQLSMTEVGAAYFREASEILQRLEDLADAVRDTHKEPRGLLRVSAPRSFGDTMLGPAIMEFLAAQPEILLDLRLDDRFVDLVEEGFDVAVRLTDMADSSLIARRLSSFRTMVVASPACIAAHGEPKTPQDLAQLPTIVDTNLRTRATWAFLLDGDRVTVTVKPRIEVNSPQVALAAAVAGVGYTRLPEFICVGALKRGELRMVLEEYSKQSIGMFAVYPHRRHLSGKVRAFVDFLANWFERSYDPCETD